MVKLHEVHSSLHTISRHNFSRSFFFRSTLFSMNFNTIIYNKFRPPSYFPCGSCAYFAYIRKILCVSACGFFLFYSDAVFFIARLKCTRTTSNLKIHDFVFFCWQLGEVCHQKSVCTSSIWEKRAH